MSRSTKSSQTQLPASSESTLAKSKPNGPLQPIVAAGSAIVQTGQAITDTVLRFGDVASKQIYRLVGHTTIGAGQAVSWVGQIPFVKRFAGVLKLDWLLGVSDRVDLAKAEREVKALQQKYPQESPSQIAHRIMVQKALYAGGMGFASSVLPGEAIALLAVDLAATTALQTEMIYQIAAAYGLELQDPARKGEALAIFGLALGGRNALRVGLGFLRNVPLAGAMIGASTNATMLYALGYAARQFYAAKVQEAAATPATATLETIQQQSEKYLAVASAQQTVMDQVLVHMILACYPNKTWDTILPELQALQLDPNSLTTIAANIQAPQPLGALLDQLNCDFAVPLLAQCQRIASSSSTMTPAAANVLQAISEKCNGDAGA